MSASDGRVLGSQKIVDHGENLERWNLVVMGDGYRESELGTYRQDVRRFVQILRQREPFGQLWNAVNVVRVDVASNASGADRTAGGAVNAVSVATYFDAFYSAPPLERLLVIDAEAALDLADEHCLEHDAVLVIVNDAQYGGSGGAAAVCGSSNESMAIGIHELAHSVFGLADEYEYLAGCGSGEAGHDTYVGAEPAEPNVTANATAATIKWATLLSPGVPVPTTSNPDCTQCDPLAADPHPAGTVGAYMGARYFHCGLFRPSFTCKMRDESAPAFCPVCQNEVRAQLAPLLPPESLVWPEEFLAFEDVPVGLGGIGITTHRALVWEVVTNAAKTFRVADRSGMPAMFDFPFGTSVTVGPSDSEPLAIARIWISYTSTVVGQADAGVVRVECVETGEARDVYVGGNTIDRPRTSLALVLDCSGSMDDEGSDGTRKIDIARRAADVLLDVMLPENALSIVRFDQAAERLMDATLMGDENAGAGRAAARSIIAGAQLEPSGRTSIGAGLEAAVEALAESATGEEPFDTQAMLVLSDGRENRSPRISDVASLINADTFAVGIGIPANLNVEALNALTEDLGGYLVITGAPDNDQETRLKKYFLQILAGVSNAEVVLDPRGEARQGAAPARTAFFLTDSDHGADVMILSRYPSGLDVALVSPEGLRVAAADMPGTPWAQFTVGTGICYFRFALPLRTRRARDAHAGRWQLEVSLNGKGIDFLRKENHGKGRRARPDAGALSLPYDVIVHAYSMLQFKASASPGLAAVGTTVNLTARLQEFAAPPVRTARVVASVSSPDGRASNVRLVHQGDGCYAAELQGVKRGLHTVRVRAQGTSQHGWDYTRERTCTFAVNQSGHDDKPDAVPERPMGWHDWTQFLLAAGVITVDKARLLARLAPNPEVKVGGPDSRRKPMPTTRPGPKRNRQAAAVKSKMMRPAPKK